jgi:hypothetical protein
MHAVDEVIFVSAPLRRDEETTRWYSEGASSCVVLTRRGRLLEPCPVFGPTSYRLLARRVRPAEASAYALTHDLPHQRLLPQPSASN